MAPRCFFLQKSIYKQTQVIKRERENHSSCELCSKALANVSFFHLVFIIICFFNLLETSRQVIKRLHFSDVDEVKQSSEALFNNGGGHFTGYFLKKFIGCFCQLPDQTVFIQKHSFDSCNGRRALSSRHLSQSLRSSNSEQPHLSESSSIFSSPTPNFY